MRHDGYIGRKKRLPDLRPDAAVILAAFGSSSRAGTVIHSIVEELRRAFPEREFFLAVTSAIIRKKKGGASLQQVLAEVEAAGFRKAVVQPLHVFPGTEYQQLLETCHFFPGLRIIVGETLLHRWEYVEELLDLLAPEFVPPGEGVNVLAVHGTPLTADPVNAVYLGLEHLASHWFPNVLVAAVEGVPGFAALVSRLARQGEAGAGKKARILPLMLVAGLHVAEDLMGGQPESWRSGLERLGYRVECARFAEQDAGSFAGLGLRPGVRRMFVARLARLLELEARY